jgi:hypothetical protein
MHYFAASRKILFCFLGIIAFAFVSCEDEIVKMEEMEKISDDDYIEPAVEQFKAPDELRISYKKARNFNKASEALVIMGQDWAEEMAQVDNEERLRMAAVYEKAQDDLIRKFGLCGKEEFKWIQTVASREPSNKDIFAKAGVWVK